MHKPLSHFADIHYGKSPSGVTAVEGTVPVYGTGGAYERATRALFTGPAIVVPRKGSLGSPHYVEGPFWPSDTTYAVIPKAGVDARWLFLQLSLFDLTKLNEATGVPSISRDWLAKTPMFEHNGAEQTASADIVFGIAAQIRQTEALIAKQERIRAGLLQDLFTRGIDQNGALRPPREEAPALYHQTELGWLPKEWEARRILEFGKVKGGKRLPAGEQFAEGVTPFPYLRVVDMLDGGIDTRDLRYVTPNIQRLIANYIINSLDVYVTIAGTIGQVGSVPSHLNGAQLTENAARITELDFKKVRTSYLKRAMTAPLVQRQIWTEIGTGGGVPKLALFRIARLLVPMPPLREQLRIAIALAHFEKALRKGRLETGKLSATKEGLMQDLLTGRVSVAPLLQAQAA